MIVKPTVFVLGAGASQPYSFPVGSKLAERVCEIMPLRVADSERDMSTEYRHVVRWLQQQRVQTPIETAIMLRTRFGESGCLTLDEFVEAEGNHHFLPFIKAGIAHRLVACEQQGHLTPGKNDWVSYLFRQMRTTRPEQFVENQVKVITFNFDRSFERKLFLMLRGSYGLTDDDAGRMMDMVPVAHVHGQLGRPDWGCDPRGNLRGYNVAWEQECDKIALSDIRIIHEEVAESAELLEAREWLKAAHTICFLGFSYHPTNVTRLGLHLQLPGATLIGTALGVSGPERTRALSLFMTKPQLHDRDCYSLLRDVAGVLNTERG